MISIHKLELVVFLKTKISGNRAEKVTHKIGLKQHVRTEANCFTGGIWLLWKVTLAKSKFLQFMTNVFILVWKMGVEGTRF